MIVILVLVLPSLTSPLSAQHGSIRALYSPSFSMPLPTPPGGKLVAPAPISGILHVLVIAAYFSDINYTVSIGQLKQEFFTGLENYYGEISYGKVSIQGDAYGWYKLPYDQAHYGKNCLSINDADCSGQDNSWEIAQDVVPQAEKDVNFANYNYVVFVHSGDGQESSANTNQVWSVTYMGGVDVPTNTGTLTQFSIVSELEADGAVSLGVWCHEFAHLLNIPDLFNTNTGQSILGPWSLMDKGTWNGAPPGSSPAHLIAWGKIQLGFISGSMLATANAGVASTFTIDPTEAVSNNVHIVEVPLGSSSNPSEYYLIEARADIGFDSALPDFGVLISLVNNNAVVGPIRIMDGHPNIPNLNDAVWKVGQTFTDNVNGLSISITGKTGNSYQVTVNRGSSQPQPQPQPQNQTYIDLAITSISAQPSTITLPNTTVTVTVEISNSGTEAANNVPVAVNLDGQSYTSLQVSVSAGSITPSTFTWNSKVGSHTFEVVIDPDNTVNNTNRAHNSATFTINVGPSLTINVPLNITSYGNIWVLINGAKYNITSNQFETSVPNGTVTIEIQPAVNVSQGVRQGFTGWSDGNVENPRQISITSATVLQPIYSTQYLLTVNANGGTTTPTGWYSPNSTVTITADNPSNVTANTSRYLFSSWSGDVSSNSTSLTVTMSKPLSIQANWIKQYYLTIISPAGTPTGEGWYSAGTVVTVGVQSTVQFANDTRLLFTGWNATEANDPTTQITVNTPIKILAVWQTQYLVTVNSQFGAAIGSGWYNLGSTAQASVPSEIDYANSTRRIFSEWTGDYTGTTNTASITVNRPKALNAQWDTEYLVTFAASGLPNSTVLKLSLNNATYQLSAGTIYQTWVQSGSTINPTLNGTISTGFMTYKFAGWRNSTGTITQNPLEITSPETYTASYTTALSVPPVPGFPLEAIILGLLVGLVVMVFKRRTGSENGQLAADTFPSRSERLD